MLDRLPYELVRRILDEAHPPFATSSSDSPSTTASRTRLRFLGGVERTCKNVQVAAHDLLWHSVWIRPVAASAKQLDRLLDPVRDERGRVRVFHFARHDKRMIDGESCVKLASVMQALRNMDEVIEVSIRQLVKGGTVDFAELLNRQCLRAIVIEGDNLELTLVADSSFDSLVLPNLRHLVLEGVVITSGMNDGLLTSRRFPVLKTVSLQRIVADGKPAFPKIEPELLQQLESVNVSLDVFDLYQPALQSKPDRILVHFERRSCLALVGDAKKNAMQPVAMFNRAVKTLVLSTEELKVKIAHQGERVGPAIRLAIFLIRGRLVSTLYRPRTLRTDVPTWWTSLQAEMAQRVAEAKELWAILDEECVDKGVEVFYLDRVHDMEHWPSWAQADPSLRHMVVATQKRDYHHEKARKDRERPQRFRRRRSSIGGIVGAMGEFDFGLPG